MKVFRPNNKQTGFTLVEIMIVVLIIGILLAIAIPNFVAARESSRAKACVGNLKQIDSAKQQCAMDNKLGAAATATFVADLTTTSPSPPTQNGVYQLVGASGYIRAVPVCPSAGTYANGTVAVTPTCTISAPGGTTIAAGTTGTTANYGVGEKFYHGLMN